MKTYPEVGSWQTHTPTATGNYDSSESEAKPANIGLDGNNDDKKIGRGKDGTGAYEGYTLIRTDGSYSATPKTHPIPSKEHPSDGESRNDRDPAASHHDRYATETAARDWSGNGSKA